MRIRFDYRSLLCRGRKKKIISLIVVFIILINAAFYITFELFSTVRRRHKNGYYSHGSHNDDDDGMPVIVGHYVGGNSGGPLPDEVVNGNFYAPVPGVGERGRPVQISQRELITAKEHFKLHSYNIVAGDKISINRTLPDMRSSSCRNVKYNVDNLPTTSVIIVFHNEAWSTLMRTVMSVLNRSPERLIKEIFIVDDASDRKYLLKELEDGIAGLKKVKLLRNPERTGLVGARLRGARAATGDVFLFLDAHCEVTPGWLEPLLERAGSDDVFICPHIDLISEDNFAYSKSITAHWGAFNWRLHFRWLFPSKDILEQNKEDPSKPYATPAMAGGLFAVRKSLFWRLGGYDEGMRIWGSENLELSWRAWQCGARVEITECSRVGHIFRSHSPYKYPGGVNNVLNNNLARAVDVWMDEYKDFFFKFNPDVAAVRDKQEIGERVELREKLKCKSFKWYLDNVWPNHFFPTNERWFGRIKNDRGGCLAVATNTPSTGGPAVGVECADDLKLEGFVIFTPQGQLMGHDGLCLGKDKNVAIWRPCNQYHKIWDQQGPRIKTNTGLCLTLPADNSRNGIGDTVKLSKCTSDPGQIWHFERVPWH